MCYQKQLSIFIFFLTLAVTITHRAIAEEPSTIIIGGNLSLSGKLAFYGEEQKNGLLLAIDDLNASGGIAGHEVKLILEDNNSEAKSAATAIQKLVNIDNADVIVSAFTHITGAIVNIISKNKRMLIYASTMPDFAKSNKMFFKDWMTVSTGSTQLLKALENEKKQNIAILTEVSDSCQEMENVIRVEAPQKGIKIVRREEFNPGETDFKPQLLRIKQKKPDAIFGCTWRDGYLFVKQLKELGMISIQTYQWTAPFLPVNDTSAARELYEENKTISNWYTWADNTSNTVRREFETKYFARFNKNPRPEAAYIYDDIIALAKAATNCKPSSKIDLECLAKNYQTVSHYGAAGLLQFDNDRCSTREVPLIQVHHGAWVDYKIK